MTKKEMVTELVKVAKSEKLEGVTRASLEGMKQIDLTAMFQKYCPATNNADRVTAALDLVLYNLNVSNANNMMFMKRGDNYVEYAKLVGKTDYPSLRAALVQDLEKAPHKAIKTGDKTVTMYPWGVMSPKMKAHSLAVSIKKTCETRLLKFDANGKAVEVTLFKKFDKKTNKEVTHSRTVSKKTVFKAYDIAEAKAFLASFS